MLAVRGLDTDYITPGGQRVRAARDVTFDVAKGEFFTLLGPSGCGKTTTLRSIAGLEHPVAGEIEAAGRSVYSASRGVFVPAHKRNFGMVFQSYAIWPHMSVYQNAAFPLQVRRPRPGGGQIREKVERALDAVQLGHLAGRDATRLSGGQQQRLALARALAMEPELLLLDEPLSNLDARLREAMRFELKRIQREHGVTTIYVTHDQDEALAMSHQIAVMNEGRIEQLATPRDLYEGPANRFVASFVGSMNFIEGTLAPPQGDGLCVVDTPLGRLAVRPGTNLQPGQRVTVAIRPEDLTVRSAAHSVGPNRFSGVVEQAVFLGAAAELIVDCNGVRLNMRAHPSLGLAEGDRVSLGANPAKCLALAAG